MVLLNGSRRSMMLIRTILKDESIIIDGDIEIVILEMNRDKVKLGIKAPEDVHISRREIDPSSEPVE
jgi:carbon storage regulator